MAITSGATPHRLYLMQVATMYAGDQAVPVPCYLIQLGDGTNILVDSGFPADVESDAEMQAEMRIEVDKDVVARLADLGLRPDDIDIVICIHLDPDHAGSTPPSRTRSSSSSANTTPWRAAVTHASTPRALSGTTRRCVCGWSMATPSCSPASS